MTYELSPYQIKKYVDLFTVFEPKESRLTHEKFIASRHRLLKLKKWDEKNKKYKQLAESEDFFWDEFQRRTKFNPKKGATLNQWISFWHGIAEYSDKKGKPEPFTVNVISTFFTSVHTGKKNQIIEDDYRIYLESLELYKGKKHLGRVFARLAESKSYIDLNMNDEYLNQWLMNRNKNEIMTGDLYPLGGYGIEW